jgi:hypothetical protein
MEVKGMYHFDEVVDEAMSLRRDRRLPAVRQYP